MWCTEDGSSKLFCSDVTEVFMIDCLLSSNSLGRIIGQQFV